MCQDNRAVKLALARKVMDRFKTKDELKETFLKWAAARMPAETKEVVDRAITPERLEALAEELLLAQTASFAEDASVGQLQEMWDFLASPAGMKFVEAHRRLSAKAGEHAAPVAAKTMDYIQEEAEKFVIRLLLGGQPAGGG